MTSAITEVEVNQASNSELPDMIHWFCCDPTMALCGTELAGEEVEGLDDPSDCVVCQDLFEQNAPCPANHCPLRARR